MTLPSQAAALARKGQVVIVHQRKIRQNLVNTKNILEVGGRTCDVADKAHSADDSRYFSVNRDSVLEVTAGRHPANDG